MAIKMSNTKDVTSKGFFALISGNSGAGKTYLARTLVGKETLIISKESGLLSLSGTDIKVITIENFDDYLEIIEAIGTGSFAEYKNIFIDSLTDILDTYVSDLKKKYPNKNDTFKMWDEYTDSVIWTIKALRDVDDHNIIFTCLTVQEKDGNVLTDQFDFAGRKLKGKMKSFFDLSLHLKVSECDEKYRYLVTDEGTSPLAKDRSGKLDEIEQADLTVIINKIKEQ